MRGCSVHYHETLDLTDSVDTKLIDPPKFTLRNCEEGMQELVSSIREKGLIQPIIVRPSGDRFEVVAGARRLEACKKLRWTRIPCIIRELSDQDSFEISLTENIQRKTMNPIEEAMAFRRYIEENGWGSETQLARRIGKSQEYVSQQLSLLSLPRTVQQRIIRRQINPSVAQEIARLEDPKEQEDLSEQVVKHHLTVSIVRETIKSIKKEKNLGSTSSKREEDFEELTEVRNEGHQNIAYPEFMRGLQLTDDSFANNDLKYIEKTVLILRLALSRLGTLIDEVPEDSQVKELLLEKRLLIHNAIDSLIKSRIKIYRVIMSNSDMR
jgi:ParB family chromosome partitioning protein